MFVGIPLLKGGSLTNENKPNLHTVSSVKLNFQFDYNPMAYLAQAIAVSLSARLYRPQGKHPVAPSAPDIPAPKNNRPFNFF
jgi:hypothetical protein